MQSPTNPIIDANPLALTFIVPSSQRYVFINLDAWGGIRTDALQMLHSSAIVNIVKIEFFCNMLQTLPLVITCCTCARDMVTLGDISAFSLCACAISEPSLSLKPDIWRFPGKSFYSFGRQLQTFATG